MVQINSEFGLKSHRRHMLLGALLLALSLLCVAMTVMFVFVSNNANRKVEQIREQYREVANRREMRVTELTNQVEALQRKLHVPPERSANSPAEKAKGDATSPPR